jgi:hypothetical protein
MSVFLKSNVLSALQVLPRSRRIGQPTGTRLAKLSFSGDNHELTTDTINWLNLALPSVMNRFVYG